MRPISFQALPPLSEHPLWALRPMDGWDKPRGNRKWSVWWSSSLCLQRVRTRSRKHEKMTKIFQDNCCSAKLLVFPGVWLFGSLRCERRRIICSPRIPVTWKLRVIICLFVFLKECLNCLITNRAVQLWLTESHLTPRPKQRGERTP